MSERERLVELLYKRLRKHEVDIENYAIPLPEYFADYLLENGVVVPQKIDNLVKEMTEEEK